MGAYGDGARPEVVNDVYAINESVRNMVIQDIHFTGGILALDAKT